MLVEPVGTAVEPVSLGELKAYLRLDTPDEDAVLAGLLRSACGLCEAFTGTWLIERGAVETVAAKLTVWTGPGAAPRGLVQGVRLAAAPVAAIAMIEALYADGTSAVLTPAQYVASYEDDGAARVATTDANAQRLRVTYTAGLSTSWNGVAEPLRQGIVRLAAHLFANRDAADEAGPPAVVAALWRPFRRVRLGS
jgi:uncharacterized phiE125 gp8 family phage protein